MYRARDRVDAREVALKLFGPGELAEPEARALARVAHPNVVALLERGDADGRPYLVLELLEGVDLAAWLGDAPSQAAILASYLDAGRGLAAAHAAGLVHRDFKPSNVIRTRAGRAVVVDFGLAVEAEVITGELDPAPMTAGTLAYMAPEHLAGQGADARSDQFSFCVAVWEALTGQHPFPALDLRERYQSMRRGPDRRGAAALGPLGPALTRGLAFAPDERHPNMDALLLALARPRRWRPAFESVAAMTLVALVASAVLFAPAPVQRCASNHSHAAAIANPSTTNATTLPRSTGASPTSSPVWPWTRIRQGRSRNRNTPM